MSKVHCILLDYTTLSCSHGYCRWSEICSDIKFSLLNKPFASDDTYMSDSKSRFLLKRFKVCVMVQKDSRVLKIQKLTKVLYLLQLLEQALAVEEQLHRASNDGLVQDPNHCVMQLHSRFTDLDCLADGHQPLIAECLNKDKNSILLMKKGG